MAEEEPPGRRRWNNSWYKACRASICDKGHFPMQRELVHQEDLIVPNTGTPNKRDSKDMT